MSAEKGKNIYKVFCGISTALMIICDLIAPVCMFVWYSTASQRQQDTELMDAMLAVVVCCLIGMITSLILAIVARIKNRQSKWALICIIISGILLVTTLLSAFFFIWAASQYHYYT